MSEQTKLIACARATPRMPNHHSQISVVEPLTLLEKTLYAVDELVGFVTACALVRPSKSVMDLEVASVRKKWKQKGFAAGANRQVIDRGAQLLGVERDKLIADVIQGMRAAADVGEGPD